MNLNISRRDFIKLSALFSTQYYFPEDKALDNSKNILILVFDALSAANIPYYGYPRITMPELGSRLDRAAVFHNHYASDTFTTPGTASLLTGTLPWTHRAINVSGNVAPKIVNMNIFEQFSVLGYYSFAYSQNPLANILLRQFRGGIDQYFIQHKFFLAHDWVEDIFIKDIDTAEVSLDQILFDSNYVTNSLFLAKPQQILVDIKRKKIREKYIDLFPKGLPHAGPNRYFILEDSINWLIDNIEHTPYPFIGYFHLLPPHEPYITRREFIDAFKNDGYDPIVKPEHLFSQGESIKSERFFRDLYDRVILYVDSEFNRLFDYLEKSGILDNTWVILTSDHGELFERRTVGHSTEFFFDPVIHIPLFVFEPGVKERRDIFQPTSAADILPTLLSVTGNPPPKFTEGQVLPPYNHDEIPLDRSIFGLHGRYNPKYKPLDIASAMHIKWPYKLTAYWGYEQLKGKLKFELFNLEEDREELFNLNKIQPDLVAELYEEIRHQVEQADRPYSQTG